MSEGKPSPERSGLYIVGGKRGIIGGFTLGTVVFTAALHGAGYDDGSPIHRAHTALTTELDYTIPVETDRRFSIDEITSVTPLPGGQFLPQVRVTDLVPPQKYARNFSASPEAGEFVDPSALDKIVGQVVEYSKENPTTITVRLNGSASAEDEALDGGLQTPSRKNLELADTRAKVVAGEVREALDSNPKLAGFLGEIRVTVGAPTEQALTDEQVADISARARESGFSSVEAFVDAWNLGSTEITPANRIFLNNTLARARNVTATINGSLPARQEIIETEECIEERIIDVTTVEKKQDEDLSWPIPGFIPIVGWRRKNKPEKDLSKKTSEPQLTAKSEPRVVEDVALEPKSIGGFLPFEVSEASTLPRSPSVMSRMARSPWLRRALVAPLFVLPFINGVGEYCDGDKQSLPMPIVGVDMVRQLFTPAVSEEISLGIPFVPGAQIRLGDISPNIIGNPGGKDDCDKNADVPLGPAAPLPRCDIYTVTRENGKVVSRIKIYDAPPLSTNSRIVPNP